MKRYLRLAVGLPFALLAACATIPPNTIRFSVTSMPEGAAVFGSRGDLLGVAPVTLLRPLTSTDIASGEYATENFTIKWVSGAEHTQGIRFSFPRGLVRVDGNPTTFSRPKAAPDLFKDIEYAEFRKRRLAETASASEEEKRKEDSNAAAGWLELARALAISRGFNPTSPLMTQQPTIRCRSQKVLGFGNPVETVCR